MIDVRIATLADNRRYIVSHINFTTNMVCCFGELKSFRGERTSLGVRFTSVVHFRNAKGAPFMIFPLADVKVTETPRDEEFMRELIKQARRSVSRVAR